MTGQAIQAVAQVQAASVGGAGAAALDGAAAAVRAHAAHGAQGATFGEMVGGALKTVNENLLTSQADLQQLAVGNVENLHQVMIRLEESRLSFQLVMQVRSRLLEAYQDLMRMQI